MPERGLTVKDLEGEDWTFAIVEARETGERRVLACQRPGEADPYVAESLTERERAILYGAADALHKTAGGRLILPGEAKVSRPNNPEATTPALTRYGVFVVIPALPALETDHAGT